MHVNKPFSEYTKPVNLTSWKKEKNLIIKEIMGATYFSSLLDSTPDGSHTDQLAFVVRYVKVE